MPTFAAFLRAVNLGEKNKIPMGELKSSFSELGYEDVTTYLQSGNVVFRTPAKKTDTIAAAVERRIADEFGLSVTVLLRRSTELRKIAGDNPFLKGESDPKKLHVVFLDSRPGAKAKADLDPDRSPPDRFDVRGREIYLHLPNGSGRSKLTIDYFEHRLGTKATARNWRTLTNLVELTQPAAVTE
jgi:uncharacterized protein (DUF1697 family)